MRAAPSDPLPFASEEHRRRGGDESGGVVGAGGAGVLVLNATYEPINVCTVRRAAILLLKQKAEMIEGGGELRSARATLVRPLVIRLLSFVKLPRDRHRRRITRRAVFARDGWTCQYCGVGTGLTVDHVIPRSKGGSSDWTNIVACCAPCNRRKGARLPAQAGMHPACRPGPPSPHVFIQVASPRVPSAWQRWLPDLSARRQPVTADAA